MSYFTNATISCFIIICLHSPRVIGKVSQQNRAKRKRKRTRALDAGIDLPYHRSWHQFSSFTILRFALTKLSLTFVFQVSRPDSSSPGQGIIAVIRDTVRACTIQEADCCFPRVDGFMHTCCAGPCIRVKARVKRSYVASNRAWNSRFPFPIELKSDANRRRFHPEINWFDNFFFYFLWPKLSYESSTMQNNYRGKKNKREPTRDEFYILDLLILILATFILPILRLRSWFQQVIIVTQFENPVSGFLLERA